VHSIECFNQNILFRTFASSGYRRLCVKSKCNFRLSRSHVRFGWYCSRRNEFSNQNRVRIITICAALYQWRWHNYYEGCGGRWNTPSSVSSIRSDGNFRRRAPPRGRFTILRRSSAIVYTSLYGCAVHSETTTRHSKCYLHCSYSMVPYTSSFWIYLQIYHFDTERMGIILFEAKWIWDLKK